MDTRRIRFAKAVLPFVLLPGLLSCSVKEDRAECPVYVTVLTDRFMQKGINEGMVSFAADELIKREAISFLSYVRGGYEQACPRKYARAAVLAGVENSRVEEETLMVNPGCQAGRVWAFGTSFSAEQDEYVVDAVPHKQYCMVKFLFDGSPTAPEGYPWRFRLVAECAGMNIYTLEPVPGPYCPAIGPNAVGEWLGTLPRQRSNNMQLEVFRPLEGSETEGPTEYVIDLGKAFEKQGYDWTAEDLKDIEVKVGFVNAKLTLTIEDWEGEDDYKNIDI